MIRTTSDFAAAFKKARSVGTPLVAIRTADPASALSIVLSTIKKDEDPPVMLWDCIQGLVGVNKTGKEESRRLNDGENPAIITARPSEALMRLSGAADDSITLFSNAHLFWKTDQSGDGGEPTVQGIWNLRNPYKATGRMLVLLITPGAMLPSELTNDVLVIDEPLPSSEDLDKIICETKESFDGKKPDEDARRRSIDAVKGLPAFPAEQAFAFCLSKKDGINYDELWERKRQVIEQTRGLSIWRGGESFNDIGGVENVKAFLKSVIAGEEAPRMAVFIDEIEKAFAGTGTDSSGVKTDMTGTMLSWMQDREADGLIFIGPPGAAKSAIAKAFGNTAGIPTIQFDFSAMQSKFVGESGDALRKALKIVDVVSQGRSFFIATCNRITSLPPELRRRFTSGTFFFDLPTAEEREVIWKIYTKKYKTSGERPKDDGWTGAEIKECCRKSYRLRMSLEDAAKYIVPVSRSASDQILALRKEASGRFLSASNSGLYQYDEQDKIASGRRSFKAAD